MKAIINSVIFMESIIESYGVVTRRQHSFSKIDSII